MRFKLRDFQLCIYVLLNNFKKRRNNINNLKLNIVSLNVFMSSPIMDLVIPDYENLIIIYICNFSFRTEMQLNEKMLKREWQFLQNKYTTHNNFIYQRPVISSNLVRAKREGESARHNEYENVMQIRYL